MGLHACNELCDLHPDMHWAQRALLDLEGGHRPTEEEAAELLTKLRARAKSDAEMISILENY